MDELQGLGRRKLFRRQPLALGAHVEDHLDEIDNRVATFDGTGWEGAAAQAYSEAHTEWAIGAREFVEGVREMSAAARAAHTRYTQAAATNYKMFNQG